MRWILRAAVAASIALAGALSVAAAAQRWWPACKGDFAVTGPAPATARSDVRRPARPPGRPEAALRLNATAARTVVLTHVASRSTSYECALMAADRYDARDHRPDVIRMRAHASPLV